jgi:hypothetical protein
MSPPQARGRGAPGEDPGGPTADARHVPHAPRMASAVAGGMTGADTDNSDVSPVSAKSAVSPPDASPSARSPLACACPTLRRRRPACAVQKGSSAEAMNATSALGTAWTQAASNAAIARTACGAASLQPPPLRAHCVARNIAQAGAADSGKVDPLAAVRTSSAATSRSQPGGAGDVAAVGGVKAAQRRHRSTDSTEGGTPSEQAADVAAEAASARSAVCATSAAGGAGGEKEETGAERTESKATGRAAACFWLVSTEHGQGCEVKRD